MRGVEGRSADEMCCLLPTLSDAIEQFCAGWPILSVVLKVASGWAALCIENHSGLAMIALENTSHDAAVIAHFSSVWLCFLLPSQPAVVSN